MLAAFLALERVALVWTRRLAFVGGWTLLSVSVLTVADALLRKFLSRPIQGAFEASELLLAALVFFALPYTGLTDGHVSVDLLTDRLRPRARSVVIAVNALICAVLLGFIAYQMSLLTAEYGRTARTTITARIPIFPFLVPITGAAWLATLGFVVQSVGALLRAIRPALQPLLR
jgi:TRAP-type C4-dicarboxylate transport system permease small subunit